MWQKANRFEPFCEKISSYVQRILLFLFYSYVKSHLDNDSCLPIYKMIPAICNTPRQIHCVRNSIFLHFIMVITCCGPSCGLWLCVAALTLSHLGCRLGVLYSTLLVIYVLFYVSFCDVDPHNIHAQSDST